MALTLLLGGIRDPRQALLLLAGLPPKLVHHPGRVAWGVMSYELLILAALDRIIVALGRHILLLSIYSCGTVR